MSLVQALFLAVIIGILTSGEVYYFQGFTTSGNFTCHCLRDLPCNDTTGACSNGCDDQSVPWAPWYGAACMSGNLAYNKLVHRSNNESYSTMIPTDGIRSSATAPDDEYYVCIDGSENPVYMFVDLEQLSVLNEVSLTIYAADTDNDSDVSPHIAVSVSDSTEIAQRQSCTHVNNEDENAETFMCESMLGRYIYIQNNAEDRALCLVEVGISGYQYHNCSDVYDDDYYYGPACLQNCHCTEQCNSISGRCDASCKRGFDGDDCQSCAANYTGEQCDVCVRGHTGQGCDLCAVGFTGVNCSECDVGYINEDCDACGPGYWMSQTQECTACHCRDTTDMCDRITGTGCFMCARGFLGLHCNVTIDQPVIHNIHLLSEQQHFFVEVDENPEQYVAEYRLENTTNWTTNSSYMINARYEVRVALLVYDETRDMFLQRGPASDVRSTTSDCGVFLEDHPLACRHWCQCDEQYFLDVNSAGSCNEACDVREIPLPDEDSLNVECVASADALRISIAPSPSPHISSYDIGLQADDYQDSKLLNANTESEVTFSGLGANTTYMITVTARVDVATVHYEAPPIHLYFTTLSAATELKKTSGSGNGNFVLIISVCAAGILLVIIIVIICKVSRNKHTRQHVDNVNNSRKSGRGHRGGGGDSGQDGRRQELRVYDAHNRYGSRSDVQKSMTSLDTSSEDGYAQPSLVYEVSMRPAGQVRSPKHGYHRRGMIDTHDHARAYTNAGAEGDSIYPADRAPPPSYYEQYPTRDAPDSNLVVVKKSQRSESYVKNKSNPDFGKLGRHKERYVQKRISETESVTTVQTIHVPDSEDEDPYTLPIN